jgi:hypothetical protein
MSINIQNEHLRFESVFILRSDHIKLLNAANVEWSDREYGAATIDPKRPYGDSNGARDVFRILTNGQKYDEDFHINKKFFTIHDHMDDLKYCDAIHKETEIALQIVLQHSSFDEGIFLKGYHDYSNWYYKICKDKEKRFLNKFFNPTTAVKHKLLLASTWTANSTFGFFTLDKNEFIENNGK